MRTCVSHQYLVIYKTYTKLTWWNHLWIASQGFSLGNPLVSENVIRGFNVSSNLVPCTYQQLRIVRSSFRQFNEWFPILTNSFQMPRKYSASPLHNWKWRYRPTSWFTYFPYTNSVISYLLSANFISTLFGSFILLHQFLFCKSSEIHCLPVKISVSVTP